MNAPLSLYAEFTALDGQEAAVATLLTNFAKQVRAEPGNLLFNPYQKEDNAMAFFVYEIYQDEAAFHAHITAEYSRVFNEALALLIVEDGSQLTRLTRM